MKKKWNIIGTTLVALTALGVSYVTGWSFWKLAFIPLASYGIFAMQAQHPRAAKWSATLIILVIAINWGWAWVNWGWELFKGNFPFTYSSLPYGSYRQDINLARDIDPGFSKARQVILWELRKKEDALATQVQVLMDAGKYGEVKTNAQELIQLRQEMEKLLAQMTPPVAVKLGSKIGVSTFTVNQDQVVSTLSFPDKSTIYIKSDKAFAIYERGGINPDGTEMLSKLTIPQGESQKYFTWGGTLRVVGLYTNTTIKLHL